jgi:hypothetical protein
VTFEEETNLPTTMKSAPRSKGSGFSKMLMSMGIVKSETGANIVLVGLALVALVVAVAVYVMGQPTPHVMTIEEKATLLRMQSAGSHH